jgi:hypothetical protein
LISLPPSLFFLYLGFLFLSFPRANRCMCDIRRVARRDCFRTGYNREIIGQLLSLSLGCRLSRPFSR